MRRDQISMINGKFVVTKPTNWFVFLCTKQLETEKSKDLLKNEFNYDSKMLISEEATNALVRILQGLPDVSAPVQCPKHDYTIYG